MDDFNRIMADVFDMKIKDIHDHLGPCDIETWDSLGQLRLVAALERHYRLSFEITEMFEMLTIGDIKTILRKKGEKIN